MNAVLAKTGAWFTGLAGWRRVLCAFAAGVLSALGFAPFGLFPFLLLGFAALVLLIEGAARTAHPLRAAALAGWAFGFGQFLLGLHWIAFAFLVDPSAHEWQIPFVALLVPGGLALFVAPAAAIAVPARPGVARALAFAVCYALGEWLRGHILTGFPWNIAGYGWGRVQGVLQAAAWFGVYGLGLLTVLFGAVLALPFEGCDWRFPAAFALLFAGLWIGGDIRLAHNPTADVAGVRLRLVQPDVPQTEKYDPRYVLRNWYRLIALSERPARRAPTITVWPEAAPGPILIAREPVALQEIAHLTTHGRILMTGAVREETRAGAEPLFYNSFYIFAHGAIIDTYDKFHLVPFGEYLPLEPLMNRLGLTRLTAMSGSFAAGDGPHTYNVPGAPAVGPLICYEILFPGAVVGSRRPGWFVNVTDDSWFGPWAGPRQHLLVARMRAIEEGLPVVRAANTGISAIIDPFGRITARLGLGRMGVLDGALPAPIAPTLYVRAGDLFFWLLLIASAGTALVFSQKK